MADEKRTYTKRQRAALEAETRRRITESAMALHGTIGPSRTSISAIAEHAGVRRSTVYRHFADEAALLGACSAHWSARNPAPDLATWEAIADPAARLKTALRELFAYYAANEQMLANLYRDESTMPVLEQLFSGFHAYLSAARDVLLAGRRNRGRAAQRIRAAVAHALAFATWRSLVREQDLTDDAAADLLCRLVDAAG